MPRGDRTGPNVRRGRRMGGPGSTQKLVLLFFNIYFEGEKRTIGINRNNMVT
jgi:hypothetical protein